MSARRTAFVLEAADGTAVGAVRTKGWSGRSWQAQLPDSLPVEVQMFLLWLAVLLTRRSHATAASTPL